MTDTALVDVAAGVVSPTGVERAAAGEPGWVAELRRSAWAVFEETPMPTTKLEEWRYTDLSRVLDLDRFSPSPARVAPDDPASWPDRLRATIDEDREAAGHIVLIDGHVVHTDIDPELASRGVILQSLHGAIADHPELIEEHLGSAVPAADGKLEALNLALWSEGIVLYVPADVRLELPIRVTRWVSEPGTAYFSRVLIVAEPHSQVSYVDEIVSDDVEAQAFKSTVAEIVARDGAMVQYVTVQRLGRGTFYQSAQRTLASRDATIDTLNVALGASVSRVDLNARLLGPGASSEMLGLYFGDGDQHFDFNTSQDHVEPSTASDLLYKGALDGNSRAIFRGIIRVHPGAQRTDAYQTNRNLLLSPGARADSLPNLEIEADDVKCSHGATVGHLDEEAKFYLMSRGLDRVQAERLVVLGFLGEVLDRLPLGGVVEKVTRVIEEKLTKHV
jgi:Fe-S cluster assembly protein SufD